MILNLQKRNAIILHGTSHYSDIFSVGKKKKKLMLHRTNNGHDSNKKELLHCIQARGEEGTILRRNALNLLKSPQSINSVPSTERLQTEQGLWGTRGLVYLE